MLPMSKKKTPTIYRTRQGNQRIQDWYEKELAATPIPISTMMVPTSFGDSHVIVAGPEDAPPLVLLHGLSINALGVRRFWLHLAKHFRVYAPDIIGQPGRSPLIRPSREGEGFGRWTSEVMEGCGLESANVMGISFGAWVAQKLAISHPDKVKQLVLFVPAGVTAVRLKAKLHFARRTVPYMLAPNERRLRKLIDPIMTPNMEPESDVHSLLRITFHVVSNDPRPFRPFRKEELAHFTKPILMMAAEHDIFYDVDVLMQAGKALFHEGAVIQQIPGQGHIFFGKPMEEVCEQIADFLMQNETESPGK
jgi:pimeloyl-ACP methyl ester carboxylesterase